MCRERAASSVSHIALRAAGPPLRRGRRPEEIYSRCVVVLGDVGYCEIRGIGQLDE